MIHLIKKLAVVCLLATLGSCVAPTRLNFACDDPTLDIYIDGEYAGRALVSYSFPSHKQVVVVSCYDGAQEVYHRTFDKSGHINNELIDLQVEQNLQYSSGQRKSRTK